MTRPSGSGGPLLDDHVICPGLYRELVQAAYAAAVLYRELVQAAYAAADRTGCDVEATPEWRAAALLPDEVYDSQFARLGLDKRKHLSNVGKHKCRNDAHLRALIDRLDQAGECIAADTIAGLIWNLDLANMRYERDIGAVSRTALR